MDAKVKPNYNLVGINSENNSEDIKTKDIKTEDIKTKDVKKTEKSESSIKKLYEWVMNNKKKSLFFGGIGAHIGWRGLNELRLLAIYKKLDEHYSHGGCSSSVERYVYRFKNNEGEQKSLVIKSIPYLSIKWVTFLNEKFACEVIPALAKENEHLANIIDYHYGLGRNYVVYEDVGPNFDWPKKMSDDKWSDKQKFGGLRNVIVQMIDIMLWLCGKGYIHGDFKFDNLSVVNKDDKPFVRVFDYGLFRTINVPPNLNKAMLLAFNKSLKGQLMMFGEAAVHLSEFWLLNKKLPVNDHVDLMVADAKVKEKYSKIAKATSDLLNELKSSYGNNNLIKSLFYFGVEIRMLPVDTFNTEYFKLKLNNLKTEPQNLKF